MNVEWIESEYSIIIDGRSIALLPKEYALLCFLYRNRGLVFSREQLLDNVWPLEYPVERTVDDHIYRLRKKLAPAPGIGIRTVRGYGYSLTAPASAVPFANPTVGDTELAAAMYRLFGTYHKYGQGRSMLTLARQQDVLGYAIDPFYLVCIHFVQGDLEWLLLTEETDLSHRLYYLVLFYLFSGGQPQERLEFCRQVLAKRLLAPPQQEELQILNILILYALAGEPHKALEQLKETYAIIAAPDYENFVSVTVITEMLVHLLAGTPDETLEALSRRVEQLLAAKPYLREIGQYHVAKGLWALRQGAQGEAEEQLDEGLQVMELSGFVPMRGHVLEIIVHFCAHHPCNDGFRKKYAALLTQEHERMGLPRLLPLLEARLREALSAL